MLPKVSIGGSDPLQRPYLKGAPDLVHIAPPETAQDSFELTRIYQQGPQGHPSLVACRLGDQSLPRDPTNQRPVEAAALSEDRQVVTSFVSARPKSDLTKEFGQGWFIIGQTTTVWEDDRVGLQVTVRDEGCGYSQQVQLSQPEGEFESRVSGYFPVETQVTQDELERAARETPESILARDAQMTDRVRLLESRYGHLRNANILELGPFTTTIVPRTLVKQGSGNSYLGLDANSIALERQRQTLDQLGGEVAARSRQQVSNFEKHIDCPDASQDLIVAYSSFGLGAPAPQAIASLQEVLRTLRPGGEFLTVGWDLENAAPQTIAFVLDHFEVAGSPGPGAGVILRRRQTFTGR